MRVLFLTHRLPYAPNRGDRIRAYHLLRLLAQLHDVDLVSLIHDDEEMSHVNDLSQVVRSVTGVRVTRVRNLISAAFALPGSRPLTHVLLHGPRMRTVLEERVTRSRPDVVVAYCSSMARYALEPPLAGIPFIFDMVDVDSEKWAMLARTTPAPRRWIYEREVDRLRGFERYAMSRASATAVVSERERALLETIAPGHDAIVVPIGVDVDGFAPRDRPTDKPCVIFCGVFNYEPNEAGGLWFAREVWPLVRQAQPTAQLMLVGMYPTRAIRALAQDPSIIVTGAVPDVRPYLWQSAVAIAPVWIARGVQIKVIEAIAAGLPCVVTPAVLDGQPQAVRSACISAGDARSFADAILSLLALNGPDRRGLACRADLSELTWAKQLGPLVGLVALQLQRSNTP